MIRINFIGLLDQKKYTNVYTITVIPKDHDINPAGHTHTFTNCECSCGAQRATAYFETIASANVRTVTYTVTGADLNSIGKATNECDFYFDLSIYSSYSSILKNLTITIGGTVFNDYRLIADGVELTGDAPLRGEEYIEGYTVIVPAYAVTGNINITLTLDVVYDLTFVLNCDKFNDIYVGPKSKTFKVIAGTSLATYFKDTAATDEVIDQLNKWVEEATLFGYAFNGFYLVDNADSLPAYGFDLASLVNNGATINTSLTFYGCWSFLIKLIEAPGTHIQTSFADSFMKDYYNEDKVTQTIQIPINSNRGYIFTIEKDPGFIGEADVKAFALTKLDDEIITSDKLTVKQLKLLVEKIVVHYKGGIDIYMNGNLNEVMSGHIDISLGSIDIYKKAIIDTMFDMKEFHFGDLHKRVASKGYKEGYYSVFMPIVNRLESAGIIVRTPRPKDKNYVSGTKEDAYMLFNLYTEGYMQGYRCTFNVTFMGLLKKP